MRVSGNPAQLTATKAFVARGLRSCSRCATSSLPVPLSPVTNVAASLRAIISMRALRLQHLRRMARNDAIARGTRREGSPGLAELATHRARAVDATQVMQQLVEVERLRQIVRRPLLQRGDGVAHVGEGGHQDEVGGEGASFLDAAQELLVSAIRVGEPDIAEDDVEGLRAEEFRGRRRPHLPVLGRRVTHVTDGLGEHLPEVDLVVYEQNFHEVRSSP